MSCLGRRKQIQRACQDISVQELARRQQGDDDDDEDTRPALETEVGWTLEKHKEGRIDEEELERAVADLAARLRRLRTTRLTEDRRRVDILRQSKFVFSTLGSSGADILDTCDFDLLIVHGANCASEATTLIPFRHVKRVVLFGDHHQLQPLVSDIGKWIGYNRSLYERLVDGGYPCLLLDTQEWYHPHIYRQISSVVYDGKVRDGGSYEIGAMFPWQTWAPVWWPNTVVNVCGKEEGDGTSVENEDEVAAVLDILRDIFSSSSEDRVAVSRGFSIGLISPYGAQVSALKLATKNLEIPSHITLK